MFGPREVLLTSEEPVVKQFLNGTMNGPIGMSEEKDSATMAAEQAMFAAGHNAGGVGEEISGIPPQMQPSPGLPERRAVARRQQRVLDMMHTLPAKAQEAIRELLDQERREELAAHQANATVTMPAVQGGDGVDDPAQGPRVEPS
jgi:phospholipid/cholesterol/gamma-HCH transport system ATP-binding protein